MKQETPGCLTSRRLGVVLTVPSGRMFLVPSHFLGKRYEFSDDLCGGQRTIRVAFDGLGGYLGELA